MSVLCKIIACLFTQSIAALHFLVSFIFGLNILKVATLIEVFKNADDPRLAPKRRMNKQYSDIWMDLFNQIFLC